MADDKKQKKYLNIALLGGGGVGKSCLSFRLIHDQFLERYDPTIEDYYIKDNFMVDGNPCAIEILDSAGQDAYASMRDLYFKRGDGFLLVYSITDSSSLEDVKGLYSGLLTNRGVDAQSCPPVTLVGNKCDLENQRVVSIEQGKSLAQSLGPNVTFVETSAKANINVQLIFQDMVKKIWAQNAWLEEQAKLKKKKKGANCLIA